MEITTVVPSLNIDFIAFAAAVAATIAAFAACMSAKAAKDASLAQIVIQLTTTYAKSEMQDGMNRLRKFKENPGVDFANEFTELKKSDKCQYDKLDDDRRRFSHYFHTLYVMLDTKVINKKFLKKIAPRGQIEFLREVIEPLEKAIDPSYDTKMFVEFRKIYQLNSPVVR